MLIAENSVDFFLINEKLSSYTDGVHSIHPSIACKVLKLKHHLHHSVEKSLTDRKMMQYFND